MEMEGRKGGPGPREKLVKGDNVSAWEGKGVVAVDGDGGRAVCTT